ncbi:sugar transferase [Haloechinothrix sp. LS1_15]|uniref:sugar transferase n=1 Tax=Haloechinothrix sp. LS1_15 TaxID=2652248 RepID=UPI0029460D7B|nr:sugar transferase [Haloechinothrix sp. LS1_15]MDV6011226.1 sugar transferase [Haloechinothrix sp. LS1_15]
MTRPVSTPAVADTAQRVADTVLAAVALLVFAVPILAIAVAIRLTSSGPALFRQRRLGRDRQEFTMLKFRTMRRGGDDGSLRELIARELRGEDTTVAGSCKLDDDPRITRIGALLRATSLDELPQLINVLRGEMSLVGPRPCLPWEAAMFPVEFDARFAVRPGITGLWQVSGRSTIGTLGMLHLDVDYVHSRTMRGYLHILWRTIGTLARKDGAR